MFLGISSPVSQMCYGNRVTGSPWAAVRIVRAAVVCNGPRPERLHIMVRQAGLRPKQETGRFRRQVIPQPRRMRLGVSDEDPGARGKREASRANRP